MLTPAEHFHLRVADRQTQRRRFNPDPGITAPDAGVTCDEQIHHTHVWKENAVFHTTDLSAIPVEDAKHVHLVGILGTPTRTIADSVLTRMSGQNRPAPHARHLGEYVRDLTPDRLASRRRQNRHRDYVETNLEKTKSEQQKKAQARMRQDPIHRTVRLHQARTKLDPTHRTVRLHLLHLPRAPLPEMLCSHLGLPLNPQLLHPVGIHHHGHHQLAAAGSLGNVGNQNDVCSGILPQGKPPQTGHGLISRTVCEPFVLLQRVRLDACYVNSI